MPGEVPGQTAPWPVLSGGGPASGKGEPDGCEEATSRVTILLGDRMSHLGLGNKVEQTAGHSPNVGCAQSPSDSGVPSTLPQSPEATTQGDQGGGGQGESA